MTNKPFSGTLQGGKLKEWALKGVEHITVAKNSLLVRPENPQDTSTYMTRGTLLEYKTPRRAVVSAIGEDAKAYLGDMVSVGDIVTCEGGGNVSTIMIDDLPEIVVIFKAHQVTSVHGRGTFDLTNGPRRPGIPHDPKKHAPQKPSQLITP